MTAAREGEANGASHLASLLKDLKVQRVRLRENLKGDVPIDYKTWTLHRKALRNVFLKLLFKYPFSSRTSGVENELWNETSLNGVDYYRKQLKKIDAQYKEQQAKKASMGFTHFTDKEKALTQQYNRIHGSFRAFLASEVVFWRELMGRVTRVFDVDEAKQYLQMMNVAWDFNAPLNAVPTHGEINTGLDRIAVDFNEELDLELQGRLPANRLRLVEIIHKCLVSCGDLSRYIELYKEDTVVETVTALPAASIRGGKKRGRGGRGGANFDRKIQTSVQTEVKTVKRDYKQAKLYYEQARSLVPSHGQPSNQIAVLYNYEGDHFASAYHYYRALCVTAPFRQARKNIDSMLTRAVQKWEAEGDKSAEGSFQGEVDEQKKALFEHLIVLHGYFFESSQKAAPKELFSTCQSLLSSVLIERALAADSIVQIVVASIASLWTRRLWRGETVKREESTLSSADAEQAILQHLLGVMTVFLQVSTSETREALEAAKRSSNGDLEEASDQSSVLAKKITAVFRRMLPAMRISSKWIKSHVDYIERIRRPVIAEASVDNDSLEANQEGKKELSSAIEVFWKQYVEFINIVRFAFPFDQLPKLGTVGQSGMTSLNFEEDRDMRGFLPMKKAMLIDAKVGKDGNDEAEALLHPNEEHLIRIADLLIDAKVIAETATSPISFDDEKNTFQLSLTSQAEDDSAADSAKASHVDTAPTDGLLSQSYDSKWERGSESTEDAVDLAMRAVDERRRALVGRGEESFSREEEEEEDDDDDGEIILIPASGRSNGQISTPKAAPASVMTEEKSSIPTGGPLTAQHLLLQMLNGDRSRSSAGSTSSTASTPQPQLLFGGINSISSQTPFATPLTSHYGGAWDGNEAAQFVNQQQFHQRQQQSRQNSNAFAHSALDPSSPWNPPNTSQRSEGWR